MSLDPRSIDYAKISSKISDQQFTIINSPPRFGLSLSLVIVLTKPSDINYHQKNPKSHKKQSQERPNPLGEPSTINGKKQKNPNNCNPDASFIYCLVGIKANWLQKQKLKYQLQDITKSSCKITHISHNFVLLLISHCGILHVVLK